MKLPDPTDHQPIPSPRLRFRPLTANDLPNMLRWLADPDVMAFYGRPPASEADARRHYLEPNDAPCWRFIVEEAGRPIGQIQYSHPSASDTWSAGIDIFIGEADARDRGLGTEAIRTMLRFLFEKKSVHRVTIDPEPANRRAIGAYEKAGFTLDGVIRDENKIDDRWVDAAFMTILDDEWPAAKARWQVEVATDADR